MQFHLWFGLIISIIMLLLLNRPVQSKCITTTATSNSVNCIKSKDNCIAILKQHIQTEINIFLLYLAMAEYFSMRSVNRYGFAKVFLDAGMQHREHASKLAEQLLIHMEIDDVDNLVALNVPKQITWASGLEALQQSVDAEKSITASSRSTVAQCTQQSYVIDYINNVSLPDQDKRIQELRNMIDKLQQMIDTNEASADYEFDKLLVFEKYILASNKIS